MLSRLDAHARTCHSPECDFCESAAESRRFPDNLSDYDQGERDAHEENTRDYWRWAS